MARSRTVKPEFFTNGELYDAEASTGYPLRLAYEALWCQSDREGRFQWKPRELKLACLPYDQVDFEAVLQALVDRGFLRKYEVDGRLYGLIPNLKRHQHFHKNEAPSKLPPPPERRSGVETAPESSGSGASVERQEHRSTTPDTDTDTDTESCPTDGVDGMSFDAVWQLYPKRPNNSKAKALRAWQARVKEGEAVAEMLAGTVAYADYVKREGVEPRYVKLASTFYGPDRHWETDYGPGDPVLVDVYDARGEITPEAAKLLGIAV